LQALGNTEWLLNRTASRPTVAQSVGVLTGPAVSARDLVLPAIKGARAVPSWVILTTIVLATTAICSTAIVRSRGELRTSSTQRLRVESEIQSLREANLSLQRDIQRLTKDPSAIELAARERLGMVKANDIVVTMDSLQSAASAKTVSFVH
jgi:cell division protein FtsB